MNPIPLVEVLCLLNIQQIVNYCKKMLIINVFFKFPLVSLDCFH